MTTSETIGAAALADFTDLPRLGVRGAAAATWLGAQGCLIPSAPNLLTVQPQGATLLRLSQGEYLLLGSLADEGAQVAAVDAALAADATPGVYALPRQDTHAWFWLGGARAVEVLAKLCGVDLRPKAFAADAIAQTSVARLNAIVANAGSAERPAFHLLVDRPSAEYFREAVLDAMSEFDGKEVDLAAVRQYRQ